MGMNIGQGSGSDEPEVMMDINTTPLIDVMLVLLIMLIITIPVQLHSVNLDMPVATPPVKKLDPVIIKLEVDANDVMYWNDWPARQPLLIFGALAAGRTEWLETWKKLNPDPTVEEIIRKLPVRQPVLWVH